MRKSKKEFVLFNEFAKRAGLALFFVMCFTACSQKLENKGKTKTSVKIINVIFDGNICSERCIVETDKYEAELKIEFEEAYASLSVEVNGKSAFIIDKTASIKIAVLNETAQDIVITANAENKFPSYFSFKVRNSNHIAYSELKLINIPSSGAEFPIGENDSEISKLEKAFEIGAYEVTFEIWEKVYKWATSEDRGAKKYTFIDDSGKCGSENSAEKYQPVTSVTWYDAVIWCNAYSEYKKITPAYYDNSVDLNFEAEQIAEKILRNSKGWKAEQACEKAKILTALEAKQNGKSNGFRLPSKKEWEFAARLRTDEVNTVKNKTVNLDGSIYYFTKGNSASGAVTFFNDTESEDGIPINKKTNDKVSVYKRFYFKDTDGKIKLGDTSVTQTDLVGKKQPNALGLFDMSGNVFEWCAESKGGGFEIRGGAYDSKSDELQIGKSGEGWSINLPNVGFRVCRTLK